MALLGNDLTEIDRVLQENFSLFAPLADLRDPDRHAQHLAVASLFTQLRYHAAAVHMLLIEELYPSAIVVTRALLEAWASLAYLVEHSDNQDESVIFLAASYLQRIEVFSHEPDMVQEYQEILTKMPPDLVETAKRRLDNHPRTWTGKTIRLMMDESGIEGTGPLYKHLCAEGHGAIGEMNVDLAPTREGTMRVSLGRNVHPTDVQSLANFARRALHGGLRLQLGAFDGPKVTLRTTDPEEWRRRT